MKKKLTLSIDDDVYEKLGEIPRKVSVSEVTSYFLKLFVEEIRLGRELTGDEVKAILDRTPEGRDFRERFRTIWGPKLKKVDTVLESLRMSKKTLKKKK